MKYPIISLIAIVCAAHTGVSVANVATTAGSNLTTYNGTGATTTNNWNNMSNIRTSIQTADANFENCEALIMRCVTPKCSSGCTDMEVARPLVSGCVKNNATCSKYGDDLINSMTARVMAQSNAKAQKAANEVEIAKAQAAAAASAAAASNEQMAAMQQQMASMQQQMQESMNAMQYQMENQSAAQQQQIQSAMDAARASAEQTAAAKANENTVDLEELGKLNNLSAAEKSAIAAGLSPDVIMREQLGGQIKGKIDDAELKMAKLKKTLDAILAYGGCDATATHCTGPKRVKKFKDMANKFFDPYDEVIYDMYDAIGDSLSVGIDVNDVLMLLSDSCNKWGKYLCDPCDIDDAGKTIDGSRCSCDLDEHRNKISNTCYYRPKKDDDGKVVSSRHCRMVGTVTEKDEIRREWVEANTGMSGAIFIDCASDVIDMNSIFSVVAKRKKTSMNSENLRNLIATDSSATCRSRRSDDCKGISERIKNSTYNDGDLNLFRANVCAVKDGDEEARFKSEDLIKKLETAVATRSLGKDDKWCIKARDVEDYEPRPGTVESCAALPKEFCTGVCKWENNGCHNILSAEASAYAKGYYEASMKQKYQQYQKDNPIKLADDAVQLDIPEGPSSHMAEYLEVFGKNK